MNKLSHAIAILGLLASSIFAADSYYILSVSGGNKVAWGTGNYVFGYTYGTVTLDNPTNPYSPTSKDYFNDGVAKIANASISKEAGVFIGVKTDEGAANTKTIADCISGFSYWYKGGAHDFNLEYPKSSCASTTNNWNNKWRISVAAATGWTKKTVALSDFTQVPDGSCNLASVDLNLIEQLNWGKEVNAIETAVTGYNLMIGNVACLDEGPPRGGDAAPAATDFAWVAGDEDICTGYYCKWGGECGLIKTDKNATKPITTCEAAIANCAAYGDGKTVYSNSTCTAAIVFSSSSSVASSSSKASSSSTAVSSSSSATSTVSSSSAVSSSSSASGGSSSSSVGSSSSSGSGSSSSLSSSSDDNSSSSSDGSEPIISYNKAPVIGLSVVHFGRSLQIASGKDATVALFDMRGKQIFSQKVLSGTTTISLQKQRQGIYYAVVKSESRKQIVKVVLK